MIDEVNLVWIPSGGNKPPSGMRGDFSGTDGQFVHNDQGSMVLFFPSGFGIPEPANQTEEQ